MKSSHSGATVTHTSVFREPDALAQFEYGRHFDSRPQRSPEARMMFAILVDAVECFQRFLYASKSRDRRLSEQAEAWIFGRENWVFSFENICEELGIDPNYLRSGLRRWREQAKPPSETCQPPAFRLPQQRLRNSDIYA